MLRVLKFHIKKPLTNKLKHEIEAESEVLDGVETASIDEKSGFCTVEFDNKKISKSEILDHLGKLGYEIGEKNLTQSQGIHEETYYVKGMNCASCEIVIERKLLGRNNIKAVDASAGDGKVVVEYEGNLSGVENFNKLFKKDNYSFSLQPHKKIKKTKIISFNKEGQILISKQKLNNLLIIAGVSFLFIAGFIFLFKSGLSALISVNASSALPMFIVFGLLAGFSSCAALVGGIILSMSKQWLDIYSSNGSTLKKLEPHILFNIGRIVAFALFGVILGSIGSFFKFSFSFTSIIVIGISVMMFFLALQMLGVKYFQKFQIKAPKFITRYIADENNFTGKYMPLVMGAGTFFLPCGFTITAQGLALVSGSALQGGLIMLFFSLGTLPSLLSIGVASVNFSKKPHLIARFTKIAGIIVLFFAVFNINSQLNVLGLKSLDDLGFNSSIAASASENGLPPIVNGKQILKMNALAYGYEPNQLAVREGIPVLWEISDKGTSGCTNAVMSKGLFDGQIELTPGKTSVKEFTPEKAGRYKFSCWMGMVSGVIDVVDVTNNGSTIPLSDNTEIIPSGAKGCGCGGGGSGSCGG